MQDQMYFVEGNKLGSRRVVRGSGLLTPHISANYFN